MQYLVNKVANIIIEKEPDIGSESIILVNGFDELKFYAELAVLITKHYSNSAYKVNIKLAKNKWAELSKNSDTSTVQLMLQNGWIAEKESVTYYRNQHNMDILILMGTEDEEDTGGLLNCYTITPDKLATLLDNKYHTIFERCFSIELSIDDNQYIDSAYKKLFEFVPVDIMKLSYFSDRWFKQFDTLNEFLEEFGKTLSIWGLPNRIDKPLDKKTVDRKKNFLRDEVDFITGKYFQRMSQKAYAGLEKKLIIYSKAGMYACDDFNWKLNGFSDYGDFSSVLLEFARGEKMSENRARLLKLDYTIINDILNIKTSGTDPVIKVTETSITGDPLEVVLKTALSAYKIARDSGKKDLVSISFEFTAASIVTGYTDADDDEKRNVLAETWKNICVHVNGIFDFISQTQWKYLFKDINIVCNTSQFFDPKCVHDQLNNTVLVATGTNTLNKIYFNVSLLDENGIILKDYSNKHEKVMNYHYSWKFDNEVPWLYSFKDLILESSYMHQGAKKIPVGVMKRIESAMVVKSEQEFFDVYEENFLDLGFNLCEFVNEKAAKTNDFDIKTLSILFENMGAVFCEFARILSTKGFYHCLCSGILSKLNEVYVEIAKKMLGCKFAENQQWIMDAYLQAFTILDKTSYIAEDSEPKCVIIPPWHPAALQKIADQKRFMLDGVTQKVEEYDSNGIVFSTSNLIDRYIRMTEIQSTIDMYPTEGNDFMGILGTYGDFCVYGKDQNIKNVKTRMKDILRKEAIYDEEFKASELTKMNDDAQMIYDVLLDYNKAMPSVKCSLSIVFINPPDLQPIISAISKYSNKIRNEKEDAIINLKLSILVKPENKGGKNYLTYWMDEYFAEQKDTNVRIYMNEWSSKYELDKLLLDNNDIVFHMDLLHAETFRYIQNPGNSAGKVSDCRFPIVYKPSPMSQTTKKRKIELTQPQFSASFYHSQIVRYKKNTDTVPTSTFLAVRETIIDNETKQIIDLLHRKAYWVVCIDKVMDGAVLRSDGGEDSYAIIGFSTGKGMYGQYNLTITARNSILETVENRLKDRLYRLFKWKPDILDSAVKRVMDEARTLDGISMLSAINHKGTNINEFMAYVMTSMREKSITAECALKVIIHLDSYKHWFSNSTEYSSLRPDFLMLSIEESDTILKIKASIIECKTALFSNRLQHIEKASKQVLHGIEQLKQLFDPLSDSIERRYWYAQLYRALVFAQVTFSDKSDEFGIFSSRLRSILDGEFEIEWDGTVLGYWVDLPGEKEYITAEYGVNICNIPQERIQKIILDNPSVNYIELSDEIRSSIDDDVDSILESESNKEIQQKRNEIINRRRDRVPKYEEPIEKEKEKPLKEPNQEMSSENSQNKEHLKKVDQKESIKNDIVNDCEKEAVPTVINESIVIENIENSRVLIGKDRTGADVCWEFGHKGLANRHLLITGTSGQGKTYGIQSMLYEVSKAQVPMLVFDYTEGFRIDQLERKFMDKMSSRIDNQIVYFTGVPIDPFKRHEIEVAGMKAPEKISDVAQRIASTLAHVYKFGDQQFAAIYDACYSGLKKYGDRMSMKYLESELNESSNKSAKTVVSKMTPFLHSVEFSDEQCNWNDILYSPDGKLTIFQLTNFVRDIQVIITEFMLWDIWHYTKKHGNKDKPFVVVLDEAQNLSHTDNSPSGMILTEGRKFGWSAWYATQSLKVLNDDEVTRLLQSAFKLYFKPTDDEIVSMAKQLNPMDANEWKLPLTSLKKGECIVVGDRIQKDGQFKSGRPTVTKVTSFEDR